MHLFGYLDNNHQLITLFKISARNSRKLNKSINKLTYIASMSHWWQPYIQHLVVFQTHCKTNNTMWQCHKFY